MTRLLASLAAAAVLAVLAAIPAAPAKAEPLMGAVMAPTMAIGPIAMVVGCELAYKATGKAQCGTAGKPMAMIDHTKNPHEKAPVPAMGGKTLPVDRTAYNPPLTGFNAWLASLNGARTSESAAVR